MLFQSAGFRSAGFGSFQLDFFNHFSFQIGKEINLHQDSRSFNKCALRGEPTPDVEGNATWAKN